MKLKMNKIKFIFLSFIIINVNCDILKDNKNKTTEIYVEGNNLCVSERVLQSPIYNFLFESNLTVNEIKENEKNTWHWHPWKSIDYFLEVNNTKDNCDPTTAGEDFPDSIFTDEQLQKGAVLLYFLGAIYFFTLLTVICNDYFLPAVECICDDLNISKDVAAATFMATATSTPEFFTNTISTFITDSDLGLGTIIGSLMFNTLGVAALAGLAAAKPVQLDWWPISRDCILYSFNLTILVIFAWDGQIFWYEAMFLVILYFLYFIVMFLNKRIMDFVKKYVEIRWNCCKLKSYDLNTPSSIDTKQPFEFTNQIYTITTVLQPQISTTKSTDDLIKVDIIDEKCKDNNNDDINSEANKSLWRIPRESKFDTFWFFYIWPAKFILTLTIPNPHTCRKLYPATFFMCIILIGLNSYLVVWMVVVIGAVLSIPDSVMGLTFLAAGGCLPEAISSVIMARKGDGGLGVSNSLGANSLAILFSLGMPWFIRTMIDGGKATNAFVAIHSFGIEFTILSLLLTVIALYTVISCYSYRLKKTVGLLLLFIYTIFLTFAILVELDIIIPSGNSC